jgi:hypothetical protein
MPNPVKSASRNVGISGFPVSEKPVYQDFRGSAKAKRISSAIVDLSYLPGAKKC